MGFLRSWYKGVLLMFSVGGELVFRGRQKFLEQNFFFAVKINAISE